MHCNRQLIEPSCWAQTVYTSTLRSYVSRDLPITLFAECVFLFASLCAYLRRHEVLQASVFVFLNLGCASSVSVHQQINRPFSAIRRCSCRGKNKSPFVSGVGILCCCAWLNVTPNSRAINCTESPLNPCLLRVSSSRETEWRFCPLLRQSESDSLIELMFADRDTSINGAVTRMWRSCSVKLCALATRVSDRNSMF